MKLGDIYISKNQNKLIQIDSFATHMNKFRDGFIIVYLNIEKHNEFEIGNSPSFNGYGTQEEIEAEYELLVSEDNLRNYQSWNEIFDLMKGRKPIES